MSHKYVNKIFGQGHRYLGCWMCIMRLYLGPSMKSVGEIASEIWPILKILANFFYLTLTCDLDLWSISSALGSLNAFVGLYLGTKSVGQIGSKIWTRVDPIFTLTAFLNSFGQENSNFKYITKIPQSCITIISNLKWIGQTV